MGQENQVAVFIDYDNIEISVEDVFGKNIEVDWQRVFQYAAQIGRVVVRRAYADWGEVRERQRGLLNLGVELVHVSSKRGKNAADIRIVIDALELLYSQQSSFSHVLLVSGDGDFVELVHRLRAQGKVVIGMGLSETTADYLVNACDKFVFYDKWQGVDKFKKDSSASASRSAPPASKNNGQSSKLKPEGKFEQYVNLLAAKKIRVSENPNRPLVIFKIFEIVHNSLQPITFNQLKDRLAKLFEDDPKVDVQSALNVAYQLFYTFCFEFDSQSGERTLDKPMKFSAEVRSAADLLDKCDASLLHMLINELGSPQKLDKETAARLLYGGVRNPKILDHIAELIAA